MHKLEIKNIKCGIFIKTIQMQTKYYIHLKNIIFSIQSIKIFLKSQKQLPLHFSPIRLLILQYN